MYLVEKRKSWFFYGYIVALAGFCIWMISWGTSTTYGVFFKPILTEFGWTRALTAGTRSVSLGIAGLLGIVTGRLTDKFGPRIVVAVSGAFLGIGYLLMSQISNAWQFYLVYGILVGIGLSAVTVPVMTTVARWFAKRRALVIGIVQSGTGIGGMVMAPLASWLILTHGWRSAYLVLGIAALVILVLSGLILRRDPSQMGQLPYGANETTGQEVKNQAANLQTKEFSLKEAICTQQFWVISIMFFAFGFFRSTTLTHIAVHATDLGFSLAVGANMLAIISGVSIVGRIGMGRLADIIGNRYGFMIGFIVTVASLLWVLAFDGLWMLYLFAGAFGFGWGTLASIRVPLLAEVFGLGSLGAILGVIEFGASTGSIVGPFLGGWLFDITGQYKITFVVTAAVTAIGLILTVLLRPIGSKGGENEQERSTRFC